MNVFPGGVTLLLTLNFKKWFFVRWLFQFLIGIRFFKISISFFCIIIKNLLVF